MEGEGGGGGGVVKGGGFLLMEESSVGSVWIKGEGWVVFLRAIVMSRMVAIPLLFDGSFF